MKPDPKVKFEQEDILKIKRNPTIWSEEYDVEPKKFIKQWGKEMEGPIHAVPLTTVPSATTSQTIPTRSIVNPSLPQAPMTNTILVPAPEQIVTPRAHRLGLTTLSGPGYKAYHDLIWRLATHT
ncbi:hypothetical protein Dimus_010877, partial [Dionaea muscipula]